MASKGIISIDVQTSNEATNSLLVVAIAPLVPPKIFLIIPYFLYFAHNEESINFISKESFLMFKS